MYVRVRMLGMRVHLGVCVCVVVVGVYMCTCMYMGACILTHEYPCVYKFNTIVVSLTLRLCISASINRGHSDQRPGMS